MKFNRNTYAKLKDLSWLKPTSQVCQVCYLQFAKPLGFGAHCTRSVQNKWAQSKEARHTCNTVFLGYEHSTLRRPLANYDPPRKRSGEKLWKHSNSSFLVLHSLHTTEATWQLLPFLITNTVPIFISLSPHTLQIQFCPCQMDLTGVTSRLLAQNSRNWHGRPVANLVLAAD